MTLRVTVIEQDTTVVSPTPILRSSGVYAIRSSYNGCSYIGSSANIPQRWLAHRSELRRGVHKNQHLQRAWTKYGEEAFEFLVLEECSVEQLLVREQHHLDQCSEVFNCAPITGTRRGVPQSPEARAKISASLMGNKRSVGRVVSPATREKLKGNKNAAGHSLSTEARAKISAAHTGRKHTPETRANMSAAQNGHGVSDETREKLRISSTGYKHTPESKAKMSAYWERRRRETELTNE